MSQNPYEPPLQPGHMAGSPELTRIEKEISSQAMGSLIVGIISFFCLGIILAPFAIYRGSKALRLIAQHNVGHQHSGTANAGKIIGIVSLVLNLIGIALWLLFVCGSVAANA